MPYLNSLSLSIAPREMLLENAPAGELYPEVTSVRKTPARSLSGSNWWDTRTPRFFLLLTVPYKTRPCSLLVLIHPLSRGTLECLLSV